MSIKSVKTRKELLKKDMLSDPYKKYSLRDVMSEENPDDMSEAINETKSDREKTKARFERLKAKLKGR